MLASQTRGESSPRLRLESWLAVEAALRLRSWQAGSAVVFHHRAVASGSSLKKRNLRILADFGFGFDFAAVRALMVLQGSISVTFGDRKAYRSAGLIGRLDP